MGRTLLDHGYSQGQRKQPNTSNDTSGHSMEREEYENRKGQWRKWKCLGEELPLLHSVPYTWRSHASLPLQPLHCYHCIQCLVPDMAMLLFTFTTTPNNLGERADGTSISTRNLIHGEGNYYKRGRREAEKGGWNPYHRGGTRESFSDRAEDRPPLINSVYLSLVMKSTVLTVVYTLKLTSLTHSLQIYCTGHTSLRSHTSWAWVEKRDTT